MSEPRIEVRTKTFYCSFTGTEVVAIAGLSWIIGVLTAGYLIHTAAEMTAEKTILKVLSRQQVEHKARGE